MSASFAGSSIWLSETSTSGGIFLLSLMYCSNWETTVRPAPRAPCSSPPGPASARRRPGRRPRVSLKPLMRARWPPSTSTFTVPSGSFSSCSIVRDGADAYRCRPARIVLRRVLLRDEQDLLVVLHHRFQRAHGFLAADEQRHDHVREHDDVAQRQDRVAGRPCGSSMAAFLQRRTGLRSAATADRTVMRRLLLDSRRQCAPTSDRSDGSAPWRKEPRRIAIFRCRGISDSASKSHATAAQAR